MILHLQLSRQLQGKNFKKYLVPKKSKKWLEISRTQKNFQRSFMITCYLFSNIIAWASPISKKRASFILNFDFDYFFFYWSFDTYNVCLSHYYKLPRSLVALTQDIEFCDPGSNSRASDSFSFHIWTKFILIIEFHEKKITFSCFQWFSTIYMVGKLNI